MRTMRSRFGVSGRGRGPGLRAPALLVGAASLLVASSAGAQLTNPDFDFDLGGWGERGSASAIVDWDGIDGDPAPGSARVFSDLLPGIYEYPGFTQCFAIDPGIEVMASARIWGKSARINDQCGVELFFFTCSNCSCASIDGDYSTAVPATLGWETVSDKETAPAGSAAAAVFLWTQLNPNVNFVGGGPVDPTECLFDSVRLTWTIFKNGFDVDAACSWSSWSGWAGGADC